MRSICIVQRSVKFNSLTIQTQLIPIELIDGQLENNFPNQLKSPKINIKFFKNYSPKKIVAFNGVPVEGCTLANQDGTSLALPITQRYLAWPSIATKREATIPRLAPAPTTLPAHFQPIRWKAIENDALSDI